MTEREYHTFAEDRDPKNDINEYAGLLNKFHIVELIMEPETGHVRLLTINTRTGELELVAESVSINWEEGQLDDWELEPNLFASNRMVDDINFINQQVSIQKAAMP
jgi:hypothetical protein